MAGSWQGQTQVEDDGYAGREKGFWAARNRFTADAANGSVPDWTVTGSTGLLMDMAVIFGATSPNSVTVTVKDTDGLTVASGTVTASGRILPTDIGRPLLNGATVSISGNTTNSAIATVVLYLSRNSQ